MTDEPTDPRHTAAGEQLFQDLQALTEIDDTLTGAVLTGFVITAEYLTTTGKRALGHITRDGGGGELTPWQASSFFRAGMIEFDEVTRRARLPGQDDEP